MENNSYIDLLAKLGINYAHPGGFELTKYVLSFLKMTPATNVLEVGCGTGKTTIYIFKKYGCQITAIENNDEMIHEAKINFYHENIPAQLLKGNVEKLPFQNESFDMILSESVTSFTDLDLSLKEYSRVLKDNGLYVAIEMSVERFLNKFEEEEIKKVYGVERILTEREWVNWFYKSNFRKVQIIGGNVIANTNNSPIPSNNLNTLSKELQNKLFEHQKILSKYKNILGYRIFFCEK